MNLTYLSIAGALSQLNVPLSASEAHGLCCGLLCAQPSAGAKTRWFTEVLDAASLSASDVADQASQIQVLDEWFGQTLASMNDVELDFTPELPEEGTPVAERMRALGDFCAGFTYGIGLTLAQKGNKPLPDDTREIIEDFQAIDAADSIDETDEHGKALSADGQEAVYSELLEYVRVGVLLVLEELRPISPNEQRKLS